MLWNPMRGALLAGSLSLLALIGAPIATAAAAASSQITSPSGPTYALYDETLLSPQEAFTVAGTTTSSNVTLRCYYGQGPKEYVTLVKEIAPTAGVFSEKVEASLLYDAPCVLRAVPVGNEEAHPPGTAAEEAGDPFRGPRVIGSSFELYAENKLAYDYDYEPGSLAGDFEFNSVGDCGLDYSRLFAANSLAPSEHLFFCDAVLYEQNDPASGPPTRSELQVDGANAYGPASAHYVARHLEEEEANDKEPVVPVTGAPQITVSKTFDPLSGLATIEESDPIVKCSPATVYPPTATSCRSFTSTGVELKRTWRTSDADQVAAMSDAWSSTDGAAHSLDALYDQTTVDGSDPDGAYEFPGESVFLPTAAGQTVAPPAGVGRIYYEEDAETPSAGDGEHPIGAIVYDTPTSAPISVYRGTNEEFFNGFEMPYRGTIPAGGSYTLNMAFVQAYSLPEVQSLTAGVLAGYPAGAPPALTIAAPANASIVSSPSVSVSGSVSDSRAITSLEVDGQAVSVAPGGGAWSTSVALVRGTNTITAVATDQAGFSTQKSVSITYAPPGTPPGTPVARASQVGAVRGANGEAKFTVACTGATGTSCEVESTLTTLEKTRGGRPVAVSARRHRAKLRSRQLRVGSSKLTIPAGRRVTIAIVLNATGKRLLARFGRLPVHLRVVLVSAAARTTVITQNLTMTPRRARRKHRGHRRVR